MCFEEQPQSWVPQKSPGAGGSTTVVPPPVPEKLPPLPPDPTDQAIRDAAEQVRRRMRGMSGIRSTFLTGPQGDTSPLPLSKTVLGR